MGRRATTVWQFAWPRVGRKVGGELRPSTMRRLDDAVPRRTRSPAIRVRASMRGFAQREAARGRVLPVLAACCRIPRAAQDGGLSPTWPHLKATHTVRWALARPRRRFPPGPGKPPIELRLELCQAIVRRRSAVEVD